MRITWHAFNLRSGRRGQRLPTVRQGTVSRVLNEATETEVEVIVWDDSAGGSVPGWRSATEPGTTGLVAVDESDRIVWGGMILRRRDSGGPSVILSLASLEHYWSRTYIRPSGAAQSYYQVDQAEIAENLIRTYSNRDFSPAAERNGLGFVFERTDTGVRRDRTYPADEDKSVGSAIADLTDLDDPIEVGVELSWADTYHTVVRKTVRIARRIGRGDQAAPMAFRMPGSLVGYEYIEDYTSDHGANAVCATSSGEGETRPTSDWIERNDLLRGGWPRYERIYQPGSSITEVSTLTDYATAELARTGLGARQLTLTARLDEAPRVGGDWWLGDDVLVAITSPRFPRRVDSDGAVQPGLTVRARIVAWSIDFDAGTLTPTILGAN